MFLGRSGYAQKLRITDTGKYDVKRLKQARFKFCVFTKPLFSLFRPSLLILGVDAGRRPLDTPTAFSNC